MTDVVLIQRRLPKNTNTTSNSSTSSRKVVTDHNHLNSAKSTHTHPITSTTKFILLWKSHPITFITILVVLGIVVVETLTTTTTTKNNHNPNNTSNDIIDIDTINTRIQQQQKQKQQQQQQQRNNNKNVPTIAYVVTITSCNGHERDSTFQIVEGASVLQHSIHRNSIHTTTTTTTTTGSSSSTGSSSTSVSQYDYQLYAFYHPDAVACAIPLLDFGYIIEARSTPVNVSDIQNTELRDRIVHNGCCGEKELIKLEAFTLTQYPLVVLLDLDVLIVQPLDRLFDFMFDSTKLPNTDDLLYYPNKSAIAGRNVNVTIPNNNGVVDLLYTTDYAMVHAHQYIKPVQGGFVILRPNHTVYTDFVRIVQIGDFHFDDHTELGWGGRTGRFWGAMTFQGLMPYYFQILHPHRAMELNWCRWNNMCSPTYDHPKKNDDPTLKICSTQQENCEDCQLRSITNISLIHYTVCQKPWLCQLHHQNSNEHRLCQTFHHEWFKVRSDMERSWGRTGMGTANFHNDHFYGFCKTHGQQGYEPLKKPYGQPLLPTTG